MAATASGIKRWQSSDCALPTEGEALLLLPTKDGGDSKVLRAVSEVVSSAGPLNARPAESLHISIGSADHARAVSEALLHARWELVIAKCAAGTEPLQVTEFREGKELAW